MSTRARALIAPLLETQHQVITSRQARNVGVHPETFRRLVRAGHLVEIEPSVFRSSVMPITWESRLLALVFRAGPAAEASHRAVARLLQIPTFEAAPLEISVPSKRGFRHEHAVIHESRDITLVPPIRIRGIPCTPPRRVALDIGAVLGETAYTTVLRELRRDHGVTWGQLATVLRHHSEHGRDGCGPLRRQLQLYFGVDGIPETTLEQTFLDHLIDACYPLPRCQHPVTWRDGLPFRLDFAYPAISLAFEVDGPHHRQSDVARRDAWRDRILTGLGWSVERISEEELVYRPATVLDLVRRRLVERSAFEITSQPSIERFSAHR